MIRLRRGTPVVAADLDARAFQLLCLTVLCVLCVHVVHLPAWYLAPLIAIVFVRWWHRRRRHTRVAWWLRIAMLLGVIGTVVVVWGTPFGRDPGAAIVCGLLVLKLLESETARDARMAIGFACFILMSVLLFDQALGMTVVVGLMLLPALATLRALEPGLPERRWLPAFLPGSALLAAGLPAALLGFLLIPRLASPLWGAPDSGVATTGMTDRMAPGDLHSLLTNDAVAMRIGFDGAPPPPGQRYFRGMLLWDFDGRAWDPGAVARRDWPPAAVQVDGPLTRYEVTLEPSHQHWLFALDVPVTTPAGARMGADRTLSSTRPVNHVLRYAVTSATGYRLQDRSLDPRLRAAALELPDGFDPRARKLAARWRASAHGNAGVIVEDALHLFHAGGFAYDLNAPPLGRNSIDDFLFDTKVGFCEHYAGAFTFLMRAAGVPARVVVGYQGGYWNEFAHYLLVRQSDAHAWSEVWLRDRGWVRVDPTAAVSKVMLAGTGGALAGLGEGGGGSWWLPWQDRLDIVNRWWGQSVVGFSALRQSHLFRPFGVDQVDAQTLGITLAVVVFLALGLGAIVASRRPRVAPRDRLAAAQRRLQARLAKAGVARGGAEGPADFFQRAERRLPACAPMLRQLADEYLDLRYAHAEPPPERARDFADRVRHFRPPRVVK